MDVCPEFGEQTSIMAVISDVFIVHVTTSGITDDERIRAEIEVTLDGKRTSVAKPAAGDRPVDWSMPFRYRLGLPNLTGTFQLSWSTALGADIPSAAVDPASPQYFYDNDNNPSTPDRRAGPQVWQFGSVNGNVSQSTAVGEHRCTISATQPD